MEKFEKIAVAVDLSDCSWEVCERAAAVASGGDSRVVLVHVTELPEGVTSDVSVEDGDSRTVTAGDLARRAAQERLARYDSLFRDAGVEVSHYVTRGRAAEGILEAIDELDADLIVLGTHGRRGLSRALLGSVAEKVTRRAPCPVMTVRSVRKSTCSARSCSWCEVPNTEAQELLAAEATG